MDTKFPADAGILCDKTFLTVSVLRDMIENTCFSY